MFLVMCALFAWLMDAGLLMFSRDCGEVMTARMTDGERGLVTFLAPSSPAHMECADTDLGMVPRHLQGRRDYNWGLWVWVEFVSGSHSHNKVGKQELKSRAWLCCNHCCRTSLKYQILSICLTVNICFQIPMARSGFLGTFLRYFIQSDLSLIQSRSDNIQEWGSNLEYFRWIWVLLRYR